MSTITTLYDDIRAIIINTRNTIYKAVNTGILEANWKIGRRIVEEEQAGASRAEYGQRVINDLAEKLSVEFGRGFDARELRRYRQFYLLFPKWDALRPELTWTHYRTLIRVENERARLYYMNEAALQNWSTRALDSQIERLTYERILSSQNQLIVKEAEDAASRQAQLTPADIIKDPYVLDFLGLPSGVNFYEKDLEKALIDNLQQFLLELGRGFSFVSRQYRFNTDNENYYVDLVFYNFSGDANSKDSRVVGAYSDFDGKLVGHVAFLSNNTAIAVSEDSLRYYTVGATPSAGEKIALDSKIQNVFYTSGNVGIVSETGNEDDPYNIKIFNSNGGKLSDVNYDTTYTTYNFDGNTVLMYGGSNFAIMNLSGKFVTKQTIDGTVTAFISTGKRGKYYLVDDRFISRVRLT